MRASPKDYIPRLLDQRISALLSELPAILIVGPRACGKTTTAARYAATTVRLDREAEAAAFQADPDVALRGLAEPILLDEWQVVPGVLGAVKRSVDNDPRPGRFLVTGSVRSDLLAATWPGTGRLVRVGLYGLTMREQLRGINRPSFLERLVAGGPKALIESIADPPDLMGYLELAVKSGFPEPSAGLSSLARQAWLESYAEQLLTRDVEMVDSGRDPDRLRRYLRAYSSMTAQIVTEKTLFAAASIDRRTAVAYEQLLTNLFVVDRLPSWSTNRIKQLVHAPKRHVVDSGLAASVLGVDAQGVLRRPDLLGSILDTFVVAQIRAEAEAAARRPRLFHLRTKGGRHEVDLIVELPNDQLVAIEIKASSAPNLHDARHLFMLEEILGDRLLAGVLFHTGPRAFSLDQRIVAAPIAALWS